MKKEKQQPKEFNMKHFKMTKLEKIALINHKQKSLNHSDYTKEQNRLLNVNSFRNSVIKSNIVNTTKQRITMEYTL